MKKLSAMITALTTGAAFTGCTFGASIDTLMAPPKLGPEQEQIYSELTRSLGTSNISLKYPKSGKYLSAFIIEDIDGDGGNEAIVFYEKNNHAADENPLRINVLDQENGQWMSASDRGAVGSEIEEVIISKLGSNDRVNLIIGTSLINRSEKNVSVYTYSNGVLQEPPTFSRNKAYAYIDVMDLDLDGENELLRITGASGDDQAMAEVFRLDEDGQYNRSNTALSDNISDFDISYGKVGDSKVGIYIDALSGTGSVQTDVLYLDGNALHKVFRTAEETEKTMRASGCTCFDIDGDGSIEIPLQKLAPGYKESEGGDYLMLTDWNRISDDDKLKKCFTSYYSVNDGYIFLFPEKWEEKVTVKRAADEEIVFCTFTMNENEVVMGRELLSICRIEGTLDSNEVKEKIGAGYMPMHTKGDSTYLANVSLTEDASGDGLSITMGEAAAGFRFRD